MGGAGTASATGMNTEQRIYSNQQDRPHISTWLSISRKCHFFFPVNIFLWDQRCICAGCEGAAMVSGT